MSDNSDCNCDQALRLQARIDELEEMLSYIATGDVFKLKDVRNLLEKGE